MRAAVPARRIAAIRLEVLVIAASVLVDLAAVGALLQTRQRNVIAEDERAPPDDSFGEI